MATILDNAERELKDTAMEYEASILALEEAYKLKVEGGGKA